MATVLPRAPRAGDARVTSDGARHKVEVLGRDGSWHQLTCCSEAVVTLRPGLAAKALLTLDVVAVDARAELDPGTFAVFDEAFDRVL